MHIAYQNTIITKAKHTREIIAIIAIIAIKGIITVDISKKTMKFLAIHFLSKFISEYHQQRNVMYRIYHSMGTQKLYSITTY